MSEENVSRRHVLRNAAISVAVGGLSAEAAQHVHQAAAAQRAAGGVYKPKLFNEHEWATLRRLAELIMPADGVSGSALDAGAAEFIDLLASNNKNLATTYTGGIAWLDGQMNKRYDTTFVEARPDQQTAMLDLLAYRRNSTPELAPGVQFFDWVRRMAVDAYYTSPVGIKDLGYKGNVGQPAFQVPAAALEYALKRSGL